MSQNIAPGISKVERCIA